MEFEELKRVRTPTLIIRSGHTSDFTHVKVAVAHGEANFCVWPISQAGESCKKEQNNIIHDSSRRKLYGLIKTQSGSTNHEKVKCTKQFISRVVYVLCSSWRQILHEN